MSKPLPRREVSVNTVPQIRPLHHHVRPVRHADHQLRASGASATCCACRWPQHRSRPCRRHAHSGLRLGGRRVGVGQRGAGPVQPAARADPAPDRPAAGAGAGPALRPACPRARGSHPAGRARLRHAAVRAGGERRRGPGRDRAQSRLPGHRRLVRSPALPQPPAAGAPQRAAVHRRHPPRDRRRPAVRRGAYPRARRRSQLRATTFSRWRARGASARRSTSPTPSSSMSPSRRPSSSAPTSRPTRPSSKFPSTAPSPTSC